MTDVMFFFFQAEDGIRDYKVTGVQTCALPIYPADLDGVGGREAAGLIERRDELRAERGEENGRRYDEEGNPAERDPDAGTELVVRRLARRVARQVGQRHGRDRRAEQADRDELDELGVGEARYPTGPG